MHCFACVTSLLNVVKYFLHSIAMNKIDRLEQAEFIDVAGKDLTIDSYDICFEHVDFGYTKEKQVIVIGALVHFLIEPGQVLCGVGGFHAQRLPELILTERVGIGALSGIIGALVLVELTQPRRWRAVEPAVCSGCREKRMSIRWHRQVPPHP